MKKLLFLTATFIMCLTLGVSAQEQGPGNQRGPREKATPEQQATRTVERLNKELQLTEKQQKDLKTYFTEAFKKRNAAMEKNKNDRQAFRQQMQKDREANDAELKKVLTAEQYKTYKENETKRIQERQQHQGRQGGGHSHR